jgi:hypothetical protein
MIKKNKKDRNRSKKQLSKVNYHEQKHTIKKNRKIKKNKNRSNHEQKHIQKNRKIKKNKNRSKKQQSELPSTKTYQEVVLTGKTGTNTNTINKIKKN